MVAADGAAVMLDELLNTGDIGGGATVRVSARGEEGWLRDGLRKRDM